ncbi:MAG: hypothetical protein QW680_14230 [Pyrobaculum sp.]
MYIITNERPKIVGVLHLKNGKIRLGEKPIAYGIYRGRLGIETARGVYILDKCVHTIVVEAEGEKYVLDFSNLRFVCRGDDN